MPASGRICACSTYILEIMITHKQEPTLGRATRRMFRRRWCSFFGEGDRKGLAGMLELRSHEGEGGKHIGEKESSRSGQCQEPKSWNCNLCLRNRWLDQRERMIDSRVHVRLHVRACAPARACLCACILSYLMRTLDSIPSVRIVVSSSR